MPTHELMSEKHPTEIYRFDRFLECAVNFDKLTIDAVMPAEESFAMLLCVQYVKAASKPRVKNSITGDNKLTNDVLHITKTVRRQSND